MVKAVFPRFICEEENPGTSLASVMSTLSPVLSASPFLSRSCHFAWLFLIASTRWLPPMVSFALPLLRVQDPNVAKYEF